MHWVISRSVRTFIIQFLEELCFLHLLMQVKNAIICNMRSILPLLEYCINQSLYFWIAIFHWNVFWNIKEEIFINVFINRWAIHKVLFRFTKKAFNFINLIITLPILLLSNLVVTNSSLSLFESLSLICSYLFNIIYSDIVPPSPTWSLKYELRNIKFILSTVIDCFIYFFFF